ITRTWTATDNCGNAITHTQVITVEDTTVPTWNQPMPANVTVQCHLVPAPASPITASDNCDPNVTVTFTEVSTQNPDVNSCGFMNYTITRTWTATDNCGNAITHTQVITVIDTTSPVLAGVPGNVTVQCDAVPPAAVVTATDNCDPDVPVVLTETVIPGNCPNNYTLIRTWTATDNCGNTATGSQVITVQDNTAPVALCKNHTAYLNANGTVEIFVYQIDNGSTDNCALTNLSISPSQFTCADVGPNVVTLTATDACGNTGTCTAIVTVVDDIKPIVSCKDLEILLDADGNPVTIGPNDLLNSANDNCGIASIELSQTIFDCSDLGTTTVKVTVTDVNGNKSECQSKVTVKDPVLPVFVTVPDDLTVFCQEPAPVDVPTATDNCDIVQVILWTETYEPLPGIPAGSYKVIRTWLATDKAGNTATHVQCITVLPGGHPVVNCNSDIITQAVQAPIQVTWPTPTVFEICAGEEEMTQIEGPPSGSYFNPGTTTRITYEFVDVFGIRYQCAFHVIVPTNAGDYLVVHNQPVTCDELMISRCVVMDLPAPNSFSFEWVPAGSTTGIVYTLNGNGSLEMYADGTARLTGSWTSMSGDGWEGTVWFFHRRTYDGWIAVGGLANYQAMLGNPANWEYFELDGSRSSLSGTGGNAGATLDLKTPKNYPGFGFQIGFGANTKTTGNGGWFTAATVPPGAPKANGQAFFSFLLNCQNVELVKGGAEVISLDGFDYPVVWSNGTNGPLLGDVPPGNYSVQVTTQSGQVNNHTFRIVKPEGCVLYWENACRESNVAVGSQAKQSSTFQNAVAELAVDGNTDGVFANGSVASTLAGGNNYWQTRLDQNYMIESIIIHPRTDCCQDRLDPFYVFISEAPFPIGISVQELIQDPAVTTIYHEGPMNVAWRTEVSQQGQYVRVQTESGDQLELAEVEVLVCQPDYLPPGEAFVDVESGKPGKGVPQIELTPGLSFWPNPASHDLNVGIRLEEPESVQLVIMSATGEQVFVRDLDTSAEHRLRIDVAGWAPGMYFVTAYTSKGATSKPLQIQR
ncbi:MAG: HYR domain-containing protein, partial [Saprospiraceae bacterium]|nr:HYR domain-containing protein [Saprospiraceae bacterium]